MNDLATMTHEELTALYQQLRNEWDDAARKDQRIACMNIDHRMSQVRAQITKVKAKPIAKDEPTVDQQPKLF